MFVRGLIDPDDQDFIVPLARHPQAVRAFDALLPMLDTDRRCMREALAAKVVSCMEQGHIVIIPPDIVQFLSQLLSVHNLAGAHERPPVSRLLGTEEHWPAVQKVLAIEGPCADWPPKVQKQVTTWLEPWLAQVKML